MSETHEAGQLDMLPGLRASVAGGRARRGEAEMRRRHEEEPAEVDPVARVLVDVPLAHLDRPFDYLVPQSMDDAVQPGIRVKVRFAGQDVDGYVVERAPGTDHDGRLTPLRRVVSPERVLTPEVEQLTAAVAARYAGARADVLRLAVPPRHATTEKADREPRPAGLTSTLAQAQAAWSGHPAADSFLARLEEGAAPRAVWQALPGADWTVLVAHAVARTRAAGKGALVCVPDHRDVTRMAAALDQVLGEGQHAVLTADQGPAKRYAAFLAALRGDVHVVIGTRSATFAPVRDLGLVVMWDDGDDLHSEPRAPYPHAREVLLTRADQQGCAVLLGGVTRTVEAEYLVRTGWAHPIAPSRTVLRERVRVDVVANDERNRGARVPGPAMGLVRRALAEGPVLVQTPRSGYVPHLACERCRTPARCGACRGPLRLTDPASPPSCGWCGVVDHRWRCGTCGAQGLRAPVLGRDRTAEEMGRMFPGHAVRSSGGDRVIAAVGEDADVVVATPGAEPPAARGYAAVLLLDTWLGLGRPDLRSDEEAVRRWFNAAALVRPQGRVVVVGDPGSPLLQSLVRWDPAGFAERELEERLSAHLPPAVRMATVTGEPEAVEEALALVTLPDVVEVLGPVPVERRQDRPEAATEVEEIRMVLRVPRSQGTALSEALLAMQRLRSARRLAAVRVQVDPHTL
ncbi:primosomal protein N' [Nocardioides daphniae]|uniref:Probable replication restart protein PriA n=1 Tax=Nocardioides daphniae TaxID=402297 RepID=A0A4P7UAK2_9ACTN|nr:primosomal protein N' [Nocardioides daphniae]QCC77132.1 primosomal protein N' [Nocardioides daphniae]GGD19900.1 putative primosomal protein N' [Nocardioides daphniae]